MRYADDELYRDHLRALRYAPEWDEYADRVFRTLDRDQDGVLGRDELTERLRTAPAVTTDPNLNGRIDRDEYRQFFRVQAEKGVKAIVERVAKEEAERTKREGAAQAVDKGKTIPADEIDEKTGLPKWFAGIDEDEDGQVALYEWRQAGGSVQQFLLMDLDDDGLMTEDECRKYTEREAEKKDEMK